MSDRPKLPNPGGDTHAEFDRDVNLRGVVWAGVGVAGLTAIAFLAAWFVFRGMAAFEERRQPEPLPMPEARERALPAGPRLQATPEADLEAMLEQEEALLERYSLVEEGGEYARIPIERAMELALERGLGRGVEGVPAAGGDAPTTPRAEGASPADTPAATTEGSDAH